MLVLSQCSNPGRASGVLVLCTIWDAALQTSAHSECWLIYLVHATALPRCADNLHPELMSFETLVPAAANPP